MDITQELCQEEPGYLYDLARHLCLASNLAGQEVVPQAADRALQALRDDIASGFDNPYKLRTDPRLEPLRKREDFPKLVQDLEAKVVMQQHVQEHASGNSAIHGRLNVDPESRPVRLLGRNEIT